MVSLSGSERGRSAACHFSPNALAELSDGLDVIVDDVRALVGPLNHHQEGWPGSFEHSGVPRFPCVVLANSLTEPTQTNVLPLRVIEVIPSWREVQPNILADSDLVKTRSLFRALVMDLPNDAENLALAVLSVCSPEFKIIDGCLVFACRDWIPGGAAGIRGGGLEELRRIKYSHGIVLHLGLAAVNSRDAAVVSLNNRAERRFKLCPERERSVLQDDPSLGR